MKNTKRLVLSCALLALSCSGALAAGVYKWTDGNGTVHYSDQKPQSQDAQRLNVRASPTTQQAPGTHEALEQLQRQQEIQTLAKRQSEEAAQEAQQRQKICESARENLEILQNNARIRVDEEGSQRFLTPEEILNKRDEFQKAIQDNC